MITDAVTNRDQNNRLLLELNGLKWEGLDKKGLIYAVVKTLKTNESARMLLQSEENQDQIKFAKAVWNNANNATRSLFLTKANNWFVSLASQADLVPILEATLERFTEGVSGGNPGARADYEDIQRKVEEWRQHVENAKTDPFYEPQPTPGIIRMVERFDSQNNSDPADSHQPNESAVTYPFILGKMVMEMKVDFGKDVPRIVGIVYDVLHFVAIHGQKTVNAFTTKIAALENISGPTSNVNLKPLLQNLINSEDFETATTAGANNKYVPNHKMTLKRIVRLVYICTKFKTVWGLMNDHGNFVRDISQLYELENSLNSPDMTSLAMVWYLAIERGNICAIMVDHWEKSASNALANLLGRDEQEEIDMPNHAFPLNCSVNRQL